MIENTLLLTRISCGNTNSRADTYTALDAYRDGLATSIQNFIAIDYYDLYFENGNVQFESIIEKLVIDNDIKNLFIHLAAEDFTLCPNFLLSLKKTYDLCLIMTSQDPETFFESRDRYYNQIADYVLIYSNPKLINWYENYGIKCIPIYSMYNKKMFPDLTITQEIDVSFIGNINKSNRREYIQYLMDNGINVSTFGSGTQNGFVNHEQMIHIINSSKINLNFTDSASRQCFDFNTNTNFTIGTNINSRIPQLKGRLIEIYLTNSFCLSQDSPGTKLLFNNEHIVFKSKEELLEKIHYFLKHDKERRYLTNQLHQQSLEFDSTVRFKKVLPLLKKPCTHIKRLYMDKEFCRNYTSYHFLFFFNFIFKGKFRLAFQEIHFFSRYKLFDLKTISCHFKMQAIYAYKRMRKIAK